MQTETFELPTQWACALLYGDDSGLDEDYDVQPLDAFIGWMLDKYGQCHAIDVADDHAFAHWHDATCFGVFPCDVSTFTFDVTPPPETQS